jgi:predicted acyltransferase
MSAAARPQAVNRLQRLVSIDALRGFTMFWIVGGDELVSRLMKWGDWKYSGQVREQLEHVHWEGFHFEDLIFPMFLFLVGVVLPFSLAKFNEAGESRGAAYWRILRRTLLLYVFGLIYYGRDGMLRFNTDTGFFDFANQRYVGVLQRIAICYGIAALITLWTRVPGVVVALIAVLAGYWVIMTKIPVPGTEEGHFTVMGNLSGYIDRTYLPGKIWVKGKFDNEGLLSTLPAVGTALLGVLAGYWLRSGYGALVKTLGLAVAGAVCLAAGLYWGEYAPPEYQFPIIKNLWTSSYVLYAGGWSLLFLALFYGVIDGLGWRWWAFFFVVIGANAITIYLASHIIGFEHAAKYLFGGVIKWSSIKFSTETYDFGLVALPIAVLTVEWLILLILYRNRVFLRV